MAKMSSSSASALASVATILLTGAAMAGAFTAAAVCPILTPISAAALGVIFGVGATGAVIAGKAINHKIAKVLVPVIILAIALTVGIVAMNALALPFTAVAIVATAGFTLLFSLVTVGAGAAIAEACCSSKSNQPLPSE